MSIDGSRPNNTFPNEMLLEIFSYLPVYSLGTICAVSRNWNAVAITDNLWKKFFNDMSVSKPDNVSLKKYVITKYCGLHYLLFIHEGIENGWQLNKIEKLVIRKNEISKILEALQIFSPVKEITLCLDDWQHICISTQEKLNEVFKKIISDEAKLHTPPQRVIMERLADRAPTQFIFIDEGDNSDAQAFLQGLDAQLTINDENTNNL